MSKTIKVSDETYDKIKDQLLEKESKEINSMEDLIGETYIFQCARYIYHGKVKFVHSDYIQLEDASVVFETGSYDSDKAENKQALPKGVNILRQSVESFYKLKW